MPVCYNYDSTTNWFGYGPATHGVAPTEQTTTAEGDQNEGKYIRVENPATANLGFFAGVIAGADKHGTVGPAVVKIFVPNGAIVPVRSYISSTVGTSALAIGNGLQYLGKPTAGMTNGAARYIAVAMETVDRSSTAGLCLAKLDPNMFAWQCGASAKLNCATTGTTVDIAANFINVSSAQTSGGFTGMWVRSEVATASNSDTALAIYGEANVTGVAAAAVTACRSSLNLWGGTQTAGLFTAHYCEIYEEGANLASAGVIAPLTLRTQIDATNGPAANKHWMVYCRCDGADKPDGLLYAESADAVGYETTSNVTGMSHISIYINGVGVRYILLEDTQ
jgi:hypothetical protein